MSNAPIDTTKAELVTRKHISRVQELLSTCAKLLLDRGRDHDASKLTTHELEPLQRMQDLIDAEGQAPYGSDEYKRRTALLKPMLDHHYAHNSHHPEHYHNGVNGMNLFDVMEMLMDWKAASERGEESSVSINKACERFGIDGQMRDILYNTADYMGFRVDED